MVQLRFKRLLKKQKDLVNQYEVFRWDKKNVRRAEYSKHGCSSVSTFARVHKQVCNGTLLWPLQLQETWFGSYRELKTRLFSLVNWKTLEFKTYRGDSDSLNSYLVYIPRLKPEGGTRSVFCSHWFRRSVYTEIVNI